MNFMTNSNFTSFTTFSTTKKHIEQEYAIVVSQKTLKTAEHLFLTYLNVKISYSTDYPTIREQNAAIKIQPSQNSKENPIVRMASNINN
ncbi:MAG: hypothetical protein AAGF77_03465 [Bacteroidota bacterium]